MDSTTGLSGIISGIDSTSIINRLLEIERRPIVALQDQAKTLQSRLSVFQGLSTRVLTAASDAAALTDASTFLTPGLSVSGPTTLAATLSGTPAVATHAIRVLSLGTQSHLESTSQLSRINMSATLERAGFSRPLRMETLLQDGSGLGNVQGTSATVRVESPEDVPVGQYSIDVTNVATRTTLQGAATQLDAARPLSEQLPDLTYGASFELNGHAFTVGAQDTLNDVLERVGETELSASFADGRVTLGNDLTGEDAIVFGNDDTGLMSALGLTAEDQQVGSDADFLVTAGDSTVHYRSADSTGLSVPEMPGLRFDLVSAGETSFDVAEPLQGFEGGRFEVNGEVITYDASDSVQDVIDRVNAAGTGATLAYDRTADRFRFSGSHVAVEDLDGNLLESMGFDGAAEGDGTVESQAAARAIDATQDVSLALRAPVSPGSFKVNGVAIQVKAGDSLDRVLGRITSSSAGVTARWDATADHVVLTRKSLGDGAITVTDDTSGFVAAAGLAGAQTTAGTSARLTVDGTEYARDSTTVDDAIGGISLQLSAVSPDGEDTTLKVSHDTSATAANIKSFVTSLNDMFSYVSDNSQGPVVTGGEVTQDAGIFLGNLDVSRMVDGVRRALSGSVSGLPSAMNGLEDVGITLERTSSGGTVGMRLAVDEDRLKEALAADPEAVQQLFTEASHGVGPQLKGLLDSAASFGSQDDINRQLDRITKRTASLEKRVQQSQGRLTRDFLAMEQALARMQGQGNTLTSILSSLTTRTTTL